MGEFTALDNEGKTAELTAFKRTELFLLILNGQLQHVSPTIWVSGHQFSLYRVKLSAITVPLLATTFSAEKGSHFRNVLMEDLTILLMPSISSLSREIGVICEINDCIDDELRPALDSQRHIDTAARCAPSFQSDLDVGSSETGSVPAWFDVPDGPSSPLELLYGPLSIAIFGTSQYPGELAFAETFIQTLIAQILRYNLAKAKRFVE
ncbi:hypothetical protein ACK9YZ_23635 [Rhizobium sp. ZK1]|uniref:hypothetical protein n=1 Tax=Rhizobium sp. ZK1 TaxID=3389872 RepID=UPI0039F6C3A7